MSSRLPKWLFGAFLAFVALELLYLLAANIALNTGLVSRIVNRKPEKYQVHWDWAWSPWPGRTYLGGIETKGQTKKFQWYAGADSVSTTYRILPLFEKTVHLTGVQVKGVDYRQRRRLQPGQAPDPADAEDPPIPGYSNPPDPPPESLYPKKTPKPRVNTPTARRSAGSSTASQNETRNRCQKRGAAMVQTIDTAVNQPRPSSQKVTSP